MQRDVSLQADVVLASFSMHLFVALSAQGDQILFLITTRVAAKFEVVYLQILHAAANLASPSVAFQHPPMQFTIALAIESYSTGFASRLLHEACRLTSERKASCCGLGKNR
jgi:hypothetical protein